MVVTDRAVMWERFDDVQRQIALYIVHAHPPVSLDALIALSGAPAITALNLLEGLKKKRIVCEKKGEKGFYFLVETELGDFVQQKIPAKENRRAIKRLIEYYKRSIPEGSEKSTVLAALYGKAW